MSESNYVLQRAEGITCPNCLETILLLAPKESGPPEARRPAFYICPRCLKVAEVGVGPVAREEPIIPQFNEQGANDVTAVRLETAQGIGLVFKLDPPVQQSRAMAAVGGLLARLGQKEMDFDFTLPGEGKEDKRAK